MDPSESSERTRMLQKAETLETISTTASYSTEISEAVSSRDEVRSRLYDEELAELTAILEDGLLRRKWRAERAGKILRSFVIFFAVVLIPLVINAGIAITLGMTSAIWLSLLIGLGSFFTQWMLNTSVLRWVKKNRNEDIEAANRLAVLEDVRAVPVLMDLIGWMDDNSTGLEVWNALGRLLPQLTEQEVGALGTTRHQRAALWIQDWDSKVRRQVAHIGTPPLLGMLHVMRLVGQGRFQIGDQRMTMTINILPSLERWMAGKGAGQDPEVQQAAAACREAIWQKMVLAKTGEQLLRASSPLPSGPETLLRPAQDTEQTAPQELLRPGKSK